MEVLEKLASLDIETLIFSCIYTVIATIIVVFMTKQTLQEKKKGLFIEKFKTVFYSVVFGGFIILFPWIAVINKVITIIIFALLCFIIIISNIIYSKKKK